MPGKRSAGILLFRRDVHNSGDRENDGAHGDTDSHCHVEVLLGHMGGPLWAKRDAGGWTIPKGEYLEDEHPLDAARREFEEELGVPAPDVELIDLGGVRQVGGKLVTAWAGESDLDPDKIVPGTFEMEWPKGSGRRQHFPELDRVAWFGLDAAREKLVSGQRIFLDRLAERLPEG